jgi:hypothetical protein
MALTFALLFAFGCKSDQEKIRETLESYANAVVIHRAPYRAYVHLDPEDKDHVSVEAYAAGFDEREHKYAAGTHLTVGDATIKGDRAEALVKISPPGASPESRRYVLRRDGRKWRVWLGLAPLDEMRQKLDEAQRLADDGALEEAKEKLEEVASTPFRASQPAIIEREAATLRQRLNSSERAMSLDARLASAMKADLETMRSETAALSEEIGPDDTTFYPRLQKLQAALKTRTREKAMEEFSFEEVKARNFKDAWGRFREARFKATNNTSRPLQTLSVRIKLFNETDAEPVGAVTWDLLEDGKVMKPGETLEIKREFDKKVSREWEKPIIEVEVANLEFADEASDDEG